MQAVETAAYQNKRRVDEAECAGPADACAAVYYWRALFWAVVGGRYDAAVSHSV